VHDSVGVAVGGRITLVTNVQVRPRGVEAETDRLTVPANPFSGATVIVEVPEEPARIWAGETAPGVTLKSGCGVNATVTVWVSVPLVPVTVTLKLTVHVPPAVSVEVFGVGRVTLAGNMLAVQPVGGAADVMVRAMLPVNPFSAFAVIVEVAVLGGEKLTVAGLALRLKSTTWNSIVAVV
jgi:hypothetical protein